MVYSATKSYDIPALDLLTFLFESLYCHAKSEDVVLHCEASNPSNAITKSQARDLTKKVAYSLRHNYGIGGQGPGKDVVICISSGQPLLPILFYSVIAAGGVYSAASSSFTSPELSRQIKQGSSNLIFCGEDSKDVAIQSANDCGVSLSRVLVIKSSPEWRMEAVEGSGACLPSNGSLDWKRITDQVQLENSLICLVYYSGTTGVPKGVRLSHTNIVAEAFIPNSIVQEHITARVKRGEPPFEYRILAHLPAAHIAGVQGYFVNPFFMDGCTYWMLKFDFSLFLQYNKAHRITYFFTVPPIFLLIAKSPLVKDHFDSLEFAISGAAPLGKELQHAASSKLGRGRTFISQTWGLTETAGSSTLMPCGESDDSGSVSKVLPNMTIRIVDDEGKDVEEGQTGELLVKGLVVTKGDIGFWGNGLLYVVDRKKELIKYKGLQVAPAELEALHLSHPKILDAAVIGVRTASTEVPRAYVVKGGDITEQEIMDFVKAEVADYKKLRGGVVFLDAVPKSVSGKILRKDLRELARKEIKARL